MAQTITNKQIGELIKMMAPQYSERLSGRTLYYTQEVWLGEECIGKVSAKFRMSGAVADGIYLSLLPSEGEPQYRLLLAPSEAETLLDKGMAQSKKTTRGNLVRHMYKLARD